MRDALEVSVSLIEIVQQIYELSITEDESGEGHVIDVEIGIQSREYKRYIN